MNNRSTISPQKTTGMSAFKEALNSHSAVKYNQDYYDYLDKMHEPLNKNIEENIFPHWRQHPSLKGWQGMNYPSIITNPILTKHKTTPKKEYSKFKFIRSSFYRAILKFRTTFIITYYKDKQTVYWNT